MAEAVVDDSDSRGQQDGDALMETAIDPLGQLWMAGAVVSDRRYTQHLFYSCVLRCIQYVFILSVLSPAHSIPSLTMFRVLGFHVTT